MFTDLQFDSFYTTEDDVVESFFNPVLMEAVSYDRASAYFSARALAIYATGVEYFAGMGHKYRLVVSKEIPEEELEEIRVGYAVRSRVRQELLESLQTDGNIFLEKGLSNLARLIAMGCLDIKVAFTREGIFHDKFGILSDAAGNRIKFTGSNNETVAAMRQNHESFSVVCSWLDKNGFYTRGINKSQRIFDAYWKGGYGDVVVREIDDVVLQEIMRHDKGIMIKEDILLLENACILDFDNGRLILHMNLGDGGKYLLDRGFVRTRLRKYIKSTKPGMIYFKDGLTYIDYKKIDSILNMKIPRLDCGYRYAMTNRLREFIESQEIHIQERSTLGIDIKRHDKRMLPKFQQFREIVSSSFERRLESRQMWDAFFMTMMRKSGNFSVPGSGKTSSVLGMFAFLQEQVGMKRILVVCPKNAFGSWQHEFRACFGKKQQLRVFNLHDNAWEDREQKQLSLRHHYEEYNLFLFNYESLANWEQDLRDLVSRQDTMLVFDEVHKIKGINGKRAESALYIAQVAHYVTVMTGTPIPNGYVDIYNMLHLMFPNEYRAFFGYRQSELKNPTETEKEDINRKLKPFYCRTTKEQLEVPPANPDIECNVQASNIENRLFYILKEAYHRSNRLLWFIRVLQLESNPRMLLDSIDASDLMEILDFEAEDIGDIDFKDYSTEVSELVSKCPKISTKMDACLRKLVRLVADGKKAICWCIFRRSIREVKEELLHRGIRAESIDGCTEMDTRENVLNDFHGSRLDVLVTNPHTLAESVSLHDVCHDAVYLEYSYNLVHMLQSKDRIHRLGLPAGQYTQYYYMMEAFDFQGNMVSLDQTVYQRLEEKNRLMLDAINDERMEQTTTDDEDLAMIFAEIFGMDA